MYKCLIVGCGYVGKAFADYVDHNGWEVSATAKSTATCSELAQRGWEAIQWDWQEPWGNDQKVCSKQFDFVLFAVSHSSGQTYGADSHRRGIANVADWLDHHPPAIYLSTTGVFANSDGQCVDESSQVAPTRGGSITAWQGEQRLRGCWRAPCSILRLAGIYGPGRLPNVQALLSGQALDVVPDSYLNLIHLEDVVQVLARLSSPPIADANPMQPSLASLDHYPLICVVDNEPVLRREYYRAIAEKLGVPEPTYASQAIQEASSSVRSRGRDHKRVSNRFLRETLGYQPLYENFRTGLLPLLGPHCEHPSRES